jgi:hypothetical protein
LIVNPKCLKSLIIIGRVGDTQRNGYISSSSTGELVGRNDCPTIGSVVVVLDVVATEVPLPRCNFRDLLDLTVKYRPFSCFSFGHSSNIVLIKKLWLNRDVILEYR